MKIDIKYIDEKNRTELDYFYLVGQLIRNEQKYELTWDEEKNILSFLAEFDARIWLITAKSGNQVGRVAAFVFNDDPKQGLMGWFECHDNEEMSSRLFDEAERWLAKQGCVSVTGPVNGCTWNNYRLNMTGTTPLFPGEPYQPEWYVRLWNNAGYHPSLNYSTDAPPRDLIQPMSSEQVATMLHEHGLKMRTIDGAYADSIKHELYDFYNVCFEGNPLFRRITKEHFLAIFSKGMLILNNNLSMIITDQKENIAAIFLSYNDIYHEHYERGALKSDDYKNNKLILKTIATHPHYRSRQLSTLMVNLIHNLAYKSGFDEVLHALMYSDNISAVKGKEKFKTKVVRTYCLLSKTF